MNVAIPNKMRAGIRERVIGASVRVPVRPERLYEVVLDVRSFPEWAPGVRRVEVIERPGEAGMVSEWEVSFLGMSQTVSSVLEEAERPGFLRWNYGGPVEGWGECRIQAHAGGALAEFRTSLLPLDPRLEGLMQTSLVRNAASSQLRRSLGRLGQRVSGGECVRVGPPTPVRA